MDFFLNRYRNLTVLILVVTAQFLLHAQPRETFTAAPETQAAPKVQF